MKSALAWILVVGTLAGCGGNAIRADGGGGGAGGGGGNGGGGGGGGAGGVADASVDGSPSCALDAVYRYGNDGGLAVSAQATLTPPAAYTYAAATRPATPNSCSPALPPCDAADAIDVADIMRAIGDADVQAAFAESAPPFFGRDTRPVDGVVFQLVRADGRGLSVGDDCAGQAQCRATPAGVAALVALLKALDAQQLTDPSCP